MTEQPDLGGKPDVPAAARGIATQGLVIFPCDPRTKQPLVQGGFKSATADCSVIEAWWRKWPTAMIGLPTGETNRVFVIDVDVDLAAGVDGFNALKALEAKNGPLPPTRTQKTPRGGEHRFFCWPG